MHELEERDETKSLPHALLFRSCKQAETWTHINLGRWHHTCLLPLPVPRSDSRICTCTALYLLAYPQQLSPPAAHVLYSLLAAMIGPQAAHHQDRSRKKVSIALPSATTSPISTFHASILRLCNPITLRLLVPSRPRLLG